MNDQWQLVFDASQRPLDGIVVVASVGAVIGAAALLVVGLLASRAGLRAVRRGESPVRAGLWIVLAAPSALFALAVIGQVVELVRNYPTPRELAAAIATGPVVEGPVEDFVPMPPGGHAFESFDVEGVHFFYSDYVPSQGFNNSSTRGGPIHPGVYVRIHYRLGGYGRDYGPVILKLEVRGP